MLYETTHHSSADQDSFVVGHELHAQLPVSEALGQLATSEIVAGQITVEKPHYTQEHQTYYKALFSSEDKARALIENFNSEQVAALATGLGSHLRQAYKSDPAVEAPDMQRRINRIELFARGVTIADIAAASDDNEADVTKDLKVSFDKLHSFYDSPRYRLPIIREAYNVTKK